MQTTNVETKILELTQLSITSSPDILKNFQDKFDNVELPRLAKALERAAGEKGALTIIAKLLHERVNKKEDVLDAIERLSAKPGGLDGLAERMLVKGFEIPKGISPRTFKVLHEIGNKIVSLRKEKNVAPESLNLLTKLRKLDRKLLDYVAQINQSSTSSARYSKADFVALQKQHKEISTFIRREQNQVLDSIPKKLTETLSKNGIIEVNKLQGIGIPKFESYLATLERSGIISRIKLPNNEDIITFARGDVSSAAYETVVPPEKLERILVALSAEFHRKYSEDGKQIKKPIGIFLTRESGIPSLLDVYRVKSIGQEAGVTTDLVVLTLRYMEGHGLVRQTDSAYELTDFAMRSGLKFSTVRYAAQKHLEIDKEASLSFDSYLEGTQQARDRWQMPTYDVITSDGGAPNIHGLDELMLGNARIDREIFQRGLNEIKKSDGLVIVSNLFQGVSAAEPTGMRTSPSPRETSGVDVRDYNNQLKLAHKLFDQIDQPIIVLQGLNDLRTANEKANVQRERDIKLMQGIAMSENDIVKAQARVNAITERAQQKYNAPLQAELFEFCANIVFPLEVKLGRELFDSKQILKFSGLNMNELEIVRDIKDQLTSDRRDNTQNGEKRIQLMYGKFLGSIAEKDYLSTLTDVFFPDQEVIEAGKVVARGGLRLQFVTPEGESGLNLMALPQYKFGISEAAKPYDKIISLLKTRKNENKQNPDIVLVNSTNVSGYAPVGETGIFFGQTLLSGSFGATESFTWAPDRVSRREKGLGLESSPGYMSFSGGRHEGVNTQAYTLRFMNEKISKVLEENARLGLPPASKEIFVTSDWQIGSPTMVPSVWVRGLLLAILNGQKEIVINGDLIQGQNYPRAVAEMQLTGLVGIEAQTHFIKYLFEPILNSIRELRAADPTWEPPKFTLVVGNHETNSQANRGAQGIWFLQPLYDQLQGFYNGAFGSEYKDHISYPLKFKSKEGIDVDYSHTIIRSPGININVAFQHYVGAGAKGSMITPPIFAPANWAKSMEGNMKDIHIMNFGHWHTQSVVQSNGIIMSILGACAGQSGFEQHLGYPDGQPSCGLIRIFSDRSPEIFIETKSYLELQEGRLYDGLKSYQALVDEHGSLDEFIEYTRKFTQGREGGNYFNYGTFTSSRSEEAAP